MTAFAHETPSEKTLSGALALAMHALFLALLVFGVSWQKREPVAMVAELWSNLPPPPAPRAEPPPPPPKVEPKPVPKVEPKPVPRAEPKPVPKADIALREKKEKERKAKEKELAEKKKREQQARLETLKLQQAQEAEARRVREQEEALRKLAAQQAAAQSRLIDDYVRKIHDRIRVRINNAGCLSLKNPEIHLQVVLLRDGNVLDEPRVRKSSGVSVCDTAVARAVLLAQPLPVPEDPALFSRLRELNLQFRPND